MKTYNSMKEFQDAVYNAAIAKQSINAMCSTQCKKRYCKSQRFVLLKIMDQTLT